MPYPPGTPAFVPGEVITEAAVKVILSVQEGGGHLHGAADPSGQSVRVVTSAPRHPVL